MTKHMDDILRLDQPEPQWFGVVVDFDIDGGRITQVGALAFWWLDQDAPATPTRARYLAYAGVPHVVSSDADDLRRLVLERLRA